LLVTHSFVKLLGQILSLSELLLESLLHLCDIPTLHVGFTPQRVQGFSLSFRVSTLMVSLVGVFLALSSGTISIFIGGLPRLDVVLVVLVLSVGIGNFSPQVTDLFDELDVVLHNVLVILAMDLILFFKTLLEGVVGGLEVLALVDVFFFDVGININVLGRVVFHVPVQRRLNRLFELIVIIDILHHPVDSIFEALNVGVVVTDLASGGSDDFLHLVLPISIIIHRKT